MFDWDQENIAHIARHGVIPPEAEHAVLNDPIDLEFQLQDEEERVVQLGETKAGRILIVATTMRRNLIRVVTAFPASKRLIGIYLAHKRDPQ